MTRQDLEELAADAFRLGVGSAVSAIAGYAEDHPELSAHCAALTALLLKETADFTLSSIEDL